MFCVLCCSISTCHALLQQVRKWILPSAQNGLQKDTRAAPRKSFEEGEDEQGDTQDKKRARLERSSTPVYEPSGMSKQQQQGHKPKPRPPTGPPKKGITKWVKKK